MFLSVSDLQVSFETPAGRFRALDGVSFGVEKGKCLGILGESGCGKSVTALTIMGLSRFAHAEIDRGIIDFQGQDLRQLSNAEYQKIRGKKISMIFQEPMTSLNPVFKVGDQILESILTHHPLLKFEARARALKMMRRVGIPDAERRFGFYPHELSGGLRQRAMIAMALACEPELLIADEPTTALDVTIQAQILELLRELQKEMGMSLIIITHDFGVASELADEIAVMYAGRIVEMGKTTQVMSQPHHPYTKALQRSVPVTTGKRRRLYSIPFTVPKPSELIRGVNFEKRWDDLEQHLRDHELETLEWEKTTDRFAIDLTGTEVTDKIVDPATRETMIEIKNLSVVFHSRAGSFASQASQVRAVHEANFQVKRNEIVGLVGESGCGKSTLARAIVKLVRPKSGQVLFKGQSLYGPQAVLDEDLRRRVQMIFQDPYSSLNPRFRVGQILEEPLLIHTKLNREQRKSRVRELMESVGLNEEMAEKFPHEFSGGQRQRIGIARALAVEPELLIADEPVSALDVSIQAQILNLLMDLQAEFGTAYVFISHNLSVVEHVANDLLVMYLGRTVEYGEKTRIFAQPLHPYTQALMSATPALRAQDRRLRIKMQGELPSPLNPPTGCAFHKRCPLATARCAEELPLLREVGDRQVACHHV